jgi:hypothetical protein
MLDEANSFHPNINLVPQVGTNMSFLVVFIENKNGILATSVYRKNSTEPYIVESSGGIRIKILKIHFIFNRSHLL